MKTPVSQYLLLIPLAVCILVITSVYSLEITEEHTFKAKEAPLWLKIEGPLSADKFFTEAIVYISPDGSNFQNMETLRVEASRQNFKKSPSFIGRVEIQFVDWHNGARYTLYFATLHFNREPAPSRFNSISFRGYPDCPDGICSLEEVQTRHHVSF